MKFAFGTLALSLLAVAIFEAVYTLKDAGRRAQFAADTRAAVLYAVRLPMKLWALWQLKLWAPKPVAGYRGRHRRPSRLMWRAPVSS